MSGGAIRVDAGFGKAGVEELRAFLPDFVDQAYGRFRIPPYRAYPVTGQTRNVVFGRRAAGHGVSNMGKSGS